MFLRKGRTYFRLDSIIVGPGYYAQRDCFIGAEDKRVESTYSDLVNILFKR